MAFVVGLQSAVRIVQRSPAIFSAKSAPTVRTARCLPAPMLVTTHFIRGRCRISASRLGQFVAVSGSSPLLAMPVGSGLRGMSITPTSLVKILSSEHGRLRRAQRRISKGDLQAAIRYGKLEVHHHPRGVVQKYTYANMVYIANGDKEITSWPVPGFGLDVEQVEITESMKEEHEVACKQIQSCPAAWTSHTVIVVDQSGSMRKDDVSEGVYVYTCVSIHIYIYIYMYMCIYT